MLSFAIIIMILPAIIGYLLGSLNSSIIVGKFYGVDIRKQGSGNAGTTNALRVLGKKAALFVLIGDLLKGILAYLAGYYLFKSIITPFTGYPLVNEVGGMIGGTAAIIGHILPVFFGFKGGKGVLTTLAVLFMIDWLAALLLLGVFIIIVAITRYVSLGSMVGAVLLPVTFIVLGRSTPFKLVFSVVIAILVVFMHRANIKRLLSGTESKLGAKKPEVQSNVKGS